MNPRIRWMPLALVLTTGTFLLVLVVSARAQVQTQKSTTQQPATKEVQVENAEIVYVKGNDLILKMSDGSLRHIPNVPDDARATVDGKEIGIKDAKVGMKLQKTITTTTTPQIVTTVHTVKGRVFQVSPPSSVILTLENGENQQFKIPEGQKFMVNGEEKDAFALRKGMIVSATKVVEEPITVVQRETQITGQMPPPPPAPPENSPILIAVVVPRPQPAPTEQAAENAPKELPQSGSELPLLGLLGSLSLMGAAGLKLFRRMRG